MINDEKVPTDFGPPEVVCYNTGGGQFATRDWLPGEKAEYAKQVLTRKPTPYDSFGAAEWAKPKKEA